MNGYQFCPHDGVGLLRFIRNYVDGGASGYVYPRRSQLGLAFNFGSVRIDPVFWDYSLCPRMRDDKMWTAL